MNDPLYSYVTNDHDEKELDQLLGNTDINKQYLHSGQTLLHVAAEHGNDQIIPLLVQRGININIQDYKGNTAWHTAWYYRRYNTFLHLVYNYPFDFRMKDDCGFTVLHHACSWGNLKLVEFILSLDVLDIDTANTNTDTPLSLAVMLGYFDVVKLLVKKGANINLVERNVDRFQRDNSYKIKHQQMLDYLDEVKRSRVRPKHYMIGRLFQQRGCGILVGAKICHAFSV